jgi:hypothetical protein
MLDNLESGVNLSIFALVCFLSRLFYKKAAHKMLAKFTLGVNYINILLAEFVPIFFCQKITNLNSNKRKSALNTFVQKS